MGSLVGRYVVGLTGGMHTSSKLHSPRSKLASQHSPKLSNTSQSKDGGGLFVHFVPSNLHLRSSRHRVGAGVVVDVVGAYVGASEVGE